MREIQRKGKSAQEMEQRKDGKPVIVMDYKTFTVEVAGKNSFNIQKMQKHRLKQ